MWETDAAGVVAEDSSSWRAYTGQTLEEWLGYGWLKAVHPDDRTYAERQWRETVSAHGLVDAEFRLRAPDGGWRWTNIRAAPVVNARGEIEKWLGLNIDIHARKRAEKALRESEERLRQFGEASQDVLWIRDARTLQWTYLTPAFETIYGLSRNEALTGDNYRSRLRLVVPEDREHVTEKIRRVLAGEQVTFDYRVRRPIDGDVRWLRDTDFPISNAAGEVTLIGGIGHDTTELRATELRFQSLLEGIPQLVWRAVDGGKWTWASPQWIDYTGQAEADSHGLGWLGCLHPDDRDAAMTAWSHAIERGGFNVEYRLCRRDGEYSWFSTRAAPVRDEAGTIVEWLGTSTDIHGLRQLQDRQGVLVAELQHRTRNLITVVRSLSDRTIGKAASLDAFKGTFGRRLAALSRVQGLLSQLSAGERVAFDELLRSELTALGAGDGKADKVTLDGPVGVPLRSATVQTFALALHELATNAVKYGALSGSARDGRLAVRWHVERDGGDDPLLHVDWHEAGVDMSHVGASSRGGGYGRELIERALPYQLGAATTYELGRDGVHCTIEVPIAVGAGSSGGS